MTDREDVPTLFFLQINLDHWEPFARMLTDAEHRACTIAMMTAWRAEVHGWPRGHLPDDDAQLATMIARSKREAAEPLKAVRRLFRPSPTHPRYLVCSWLQESLERATHSVITRRENGRRGGRPRQEKPTGIATGKPAGYPVGYAAGSDLVAKESGRVTTRITGRDTDRETIGIGIEIGTPGTAESLQDSATYPASADPISAVYGPTDAHSAVEGADPALSGSATGRPFTADALDTTRLSHEELARKFEQAKRVKLQGHAQRR